MGNETPRWRSRSVRTKPARADAVIHNNAVNAQVKKKPDSTAVGSRTRMMCDMTEALFSGACHRYNGESAL